MWIFAYIAEPVTAELDAKEYITYRCICSKRRRLGLLYRVHICGDSDYFWDSVYPLPSTEEKSVPVDFTRFTFLFCNFFWVNLFSVSEGYQIVICHQSLK